MPPADAPGSALSSCLAALSILALGLATAPSEARADDDAQGSERVAQNGQPSRGAEVASDDAADGARSVSRRPSRHFQRPSEEFSPGWGSIDLLAGLQFGSSTGVLFAAVEVTPVSIEGAVALSLGIRGEAGYCALRCFDQDVHARYVAPLGVGVLHFPFVGRGLSLPELDAYVAATVGPAFYWFQPAPELATRRDRVWMVTPLLGVRAPFTRAGLAFAFFEASWRFALGDGRVEYGFDLDAPFDRTAAHAVDVAPAGPRLAGGLGLRF